MKKIGKYSVTGLLGQGGMGKVFKIQYPVTGKIGALKYLDPNPLLISMMGQKAVENLFTREAMTMAKIRHPNILELFDFDRSKGKLYYTMDFYCNNLGQLMGESMETERPTRILTLEKTFHHARQILEGLGCLHWSGIIHRDIKPFNIMLTELDVIKIGDFGLSKLRGEDMPIHGSVKVGSPYYAAPEQEKNPEHATEASDLYSMGVMLFRMVTGVLPESNGVLASSYNNDLDEQWDLFFKKAMAPDPSHRFQTTQQMALDLEKLEQQWIKQKERMCALPEDFLEKPPLKTGNITLRKTPVKALQGDAPDMFNLTDLMEPVKFIKNNFEKIESDQVLDHATGLVWQKSGSPYPMNWKDAHDYIDHLNQHKSTSSPWRLPTIEELVTILSPLPQGIGHCLEPIFDQRQTYLWSCDRCTFISGWYVNLEMGFVDKNDFSSFYHIKAVRDH
ncbi:serine/threonine protein kinase [Desulfocicer vacuolatum DSM 3385]|uniref:Serine/threonine protein kinase n=1 Tax=Desulfocicer vacuolatum DSM 3385 TaxID=1121400 RepID=A0A1W2CJW4_9BACT|nr:protein kinase [Desulfocicer vacuolatum]SMC85480.1 serine/threonine protein kinase [Desulfocicer vacuolatum DSM 3385]